MNTSESFKEWMQKIMGEKPQENINNEQEVVTDPGYPAVTDGGEVYTPPTPKSTSEKFADFMFKSGI